MSSLVFPFHDPKNIETKFLKQVLPILMENFDNVFVSITPKTAIENPEAVAFLKGDKFFIVKFNPENSTVGEHFVNAYKNAAENSKPEQILHLCTCDRLAFALLTEYKNDFIRDLNNHEESPVLFTRSAKAWSTHPQNYYAAESMVTELGKKLFGKELDFGWCHLTIRADKLREILNNVASHDFVFLAQMLLAIKNDLVIKKVDWLSWEDPFIFNKDSALFKKEREKDPVEFEKRMNFVLPQIKYLFEEYRKLV